MDVLDYVRTFLGTDTPFMLLFVTLFFYFIKTSREREKENHNISEIQLNSIKQDIQVLIKVWQILLEKELERKKNDDK
jgi:BhlA-like holin